MSYISALAPNTDVSQLAPGNTNWQQMPAFTKIPAGGRPASIQIRSINGSGDGSPFWVQYNLASAPSDTSKARLVSGSGQTPVMAGGIRNIWIKATAATDTIIAEAAF